jgi:hypothetical protein
MKRRLRAAGIVFGLAAMLLLPSNAAAEVSEVRIARGSLKTMPASWKEHFFGEIRELPGS